MSYIPSIKEINGEQSKLNVFTLITKFVLIFVNL